VGISVSDIELGDIDQSQCHNVFEKKREKHKHCDIVIDQFHQILLHPIATLMWAKESFACVA